MNLKTGKSGIKAIILINLITKEFKMEFNLTSNVSNGKREVQARYYSSKDGLGSDMTVMVWVDNVDSIIEISRLARKEVLRLLQEVVDNNSQP